MMNAKVMLFFILFSMLVILGCLGNNQDTKTEVTENVEQTKPSIKEINDQTLENDENEIIQEGIEEEINIMEFEEDPNAPLEIHMFNMGFSEEEQGRLIIIKKKDFDAVIANVQKEKISDAIASIKSISDDVELFIVPSPDKYEQNLRLLDELKVGILILPDIDNEKIKALRTKAIEKNIIVRRVRSGERITYNGIVFNFYSPYPNEFLPTDERNNAIIMKIKDRNFSMLFTTDAVSGVLMKTFSKYKNELQTNILEIPYYGYSYDYITMAKLIDFSRPNVAIIEGYPNVPLEHTQMDPRKTLEELTRLKGIELIKLWENNITIRYDGEFYGIIRH